MSFLAVCRMLFHLEIIEETQNYSSTKICAWIVQCCTHRSTKDISLLKNVSSKLKAVEGKSERVVYYSYNIARPQGWNLGHLKFQIKLECCHSDVKLMRRVWKKSWQEALEHEEICHLQHSVCISFFLFSWPCILLKLFLPNSTLTQISVNAIIKRSSSSGYMGAYMAFITSHLLVFCEAIQVLRLSCILKNTQNQPLSQFSFAFFQPTSWMYSFLWLLVCPLNSPSQSAVL